MNILQSLKRALAVPEIRKRLLFTIFMLVIYRFLANIPSPGVDTTVLKNIFSQNQILGLVDLFSGGAFARFAIIALGLSPYVATSFMISILSKVIPQLKELQEQGEHGRRIIVQLTRIITIPVALLQSISTVALLKNLNALHSFDAITVATLVITMIASSLLLMWIGENITESGLGQGVSILIACNILASIPNALIQIIHSQSTDIFTILIVIFIYIGVIVTGIWVIESVRKIPVSYTRRVRGMGSDKSYIPLTANATVMNGVFLSTYFLYIPLGIGQLLQNSSFTQIKTVAGYIVNIFSDKLYMPIINFVFVFIFAYYFTFIYFNPKELAENQQKQGGFIVGIRPGKHTADYILTILKRYALIAALFICVIVTVPLVLENASNLQSLSISGTGILIVIGVILPIFRQIKSYMVTQSYDKFTR